MQVTYDIGKVIATLAAHSLEKFNKVGEKQLLNKPGMKLGHAVDLVRTNDSKVGHPDLLRLSYFDAEREGVY